MTESDLDSLYGELCGTLSEVGEARAPLFLARFALLAIEQIGDPERVRALLVSARYCEPSLDWRGAPRRSDRDRYGCPVP